MRKITNQGQQKTMAKKQIELTEQDLHFLVEQSVRNYLIQEGFLSNMWNGAKNVAGGAWDAAKAVGNTAGAMYSKGGVTNQTAPQGGATQPQGNGQTPLERLRGVR